MEISAVMLGVLLGSVLVVVGRMQRMAVRDLGMVRSLFVIAGFVVLGGLAMMLGGVFMMVRGVLMVLVNVVTAHGCLPGINGRRRALPGSVNHLRRGFVRSSGFHRLLSSFS
jgi:hypothetical protein